MVSGDTRQEDPIPAGRIDGDQGALRGCVFHGREKSQAMAAQSANRPKLAKDERTCRQDDAAIRVSGTAKRLKDRTDFSRQLILQNQLDKASNATFARFSLATAVITAPATQSAGQALALTGP